MVLQVLRCHRMDSHTQECGMIGKEILAIETIYIIPKDWLWVPFETIKTKGIILVMLLWRRGSRKSGYK